MKSPHPHSSIHHKNFIFTENLSVKSRIISTIMLNIKASSPFEHLLLFTQQFQLFSQLLLHSQSLQPTLDLSSDLFTEPIYFLARLLSPGWFLDFTSRASLSTIIAIITAILCIVKGSLFAYILAFGAQKVPQNRLIFKIYNWELYLRLPLTSFFILSISSRMILLCSQNQISSISESVNILYIIFFASVCLLQCWKVFGQLFFLTNLLPNSSLLASNHQHSDTITTIHQLSLLILQFIPDSNPPRQTLWILTCISLPFCIISLGLHLSRFTYHYVQSLYFKGYFLSLVMLFNVILLARAIVLSYFTKHIFGVDTSLIIFGLLTPVVIKLVKSYLNSAILRLMGADHESETQLIYKLSVVFHLFRTHKPLGNNYLPTDLAYLLFNSVLSKSDLVFNIQGYNLSNLSTELLLNQISALYLEKLSERFPKSDLIKLYIAYYHGKKLRNYETAIKILAKLEGTPSHNIRTSATLLGRDIERMIRTQTSSTETRQIDLKSYLESRMAVLKLREEIVKQVNIQLNLYQESEKQDPDMHLVSQVSQKTFKQRSSVLKLIGNTLPGLPECYLEPYFLLEGYYGKVNNSLLEQMKCKGIIEKKYQRYQKAWTSNQINTENLYNSGNVLLVISGQKETMGQIHYSSSSALKTLGWDSKMLKGRNISSLVPGSFQEFYNRIMRKFNEESTKIPTDQICRAFMLHKGGYSIQVDICIAIHPFMHQGFFLDVVIRPVLENNKEYLVVLPDGKLDSFTEKIGRKLGLRDHMKHVLQVNELSNDLEEVNKAFEFLMNIKMRSATTVQDTKIFEEKISIPSEQQLLSRRSSTITTSTRDRTMKGLVRQLQTLKLTMGPGQMDLNKASDLVEKYATEGENVRFLPIGGSGENGYLYHCRIEEKDYLETRLRVYTLQEIKKEVGESESSEILVKGMTPKRSGTLGGLSRKRQKTTLVVLESEDSDGSEIGEEKQPGDIDITKEYFEKDISTSRALSPFKVKSPRKKGLKFDLAGEPLSTERVFIQKSPSSNSQLNTATSPQMAGADSKGKQRKFNFIQKQVTIKTPEEVVVQAEKSVGSLKSEKANSKKLLAIYAQAIQAKFYPKYIQTVFILLALLYAVIFALQVNSGTILNAVLNRAERRKEVIQAADLRNLLLIDINDIVRYELQILTMTSNTGYLGTDEMEKLIEQTERLQDVNSDLLSAASYLQTETDRQRLFQKDVRVYDTYFHDPNPSFISLTSIQAVDRIVSSIDQARYAIVVNNTGLAETSLQFVLRNSLNDLLLASEKILDIFVNSLTIFRKDNDVFLEARFFINLFLLIGSFWIAALAIWVQYKREKTNILAFSRLAPEEVGLLIGKVQEYKKSVEEETYWEKKEEEGDNSSSDSGVDLKGNAKKFRREGNYHGVTREYLGFTLKLLFLLLVLIGCYTMNFVLLKNTISPVYRKANQLHYSDWMLGRISLCYTSLIELVAEENMVFIRNQPADDQAKESLAQVQQIIRNITTGFFEDENGNYDEDISGFLFEDICSHVPDKYLQQICFDIQSGGGVMTLVNLISMIEYGTKQILQEYSQMTNKTIGPLFTLNLEVASTLYKPLVIAQVTNSLLSRRINELFVRDLDQAKWKNISMCIWVSCLLAVMIVLFWVFIFRGIRESDNKFKNVLSMFPPGYILSNFILKNYLKKTSSEAFNLINSLTAEYFQAIEISAKITCIFCSAFWIQQIFRVQDSEFSGLCDFSSDFFDLFECLRIFFDLPRKIREMIENDRE